LLQDGHDLFDTEALLFHGKALPFFRSRFCRKLTLYVE